MLDASTESSMPFSIGAQVGIGVAGASVGFGVAGASVGFGATRITELTFIEPSSVYTPFASSYATNDPFNSLISKSDVSSFFKVIVILPIAPSADVLFVADIADTVYVFASALYSSVTVPNNVSSVFTDSTLSSGISITIVYVAIPVGIPQYLKLITFTVSVLEESNESSIPSVGSSALTIVKLANNENIIANEQINAINLFVFFTIQTPF